MPKTKEKTSIDRSASGDIPFIEWYDENGVFKTGDNTYTLVCRFANTGYLSKTDLEKERKYQSYRQLLREIPPFIHYQEIVYNMPVDSEKYALAIASKAPPYTTRYEEAFFSVQRSFAENVSDDHSIQKYLLCLSVTITDNEKPFNKLFDAFTLVKTRFADMGAVLTALSANEVFSELHHVYNPFKPSMMPIPSNLYRRGYTVKDMICADGIQYKANHIELGTEYCRVLSVSSYGSEISDTLIYTLLNNNMNVYLSKHIDHVEKTIAIKQINAQLDELVARAEMKKEKSTYIPGALKRSLQGCEELLKQLSDGEEFLRQTVYVAVFAKTLEQLKSDSDRVCATALSLGCELRCVTVQTDKALKSILPLGRDYLVRHQFMLSGEGAVATPFSYESYFDKNGFFYGYNYYNSEPVIRNRKADKSSHGFVFGATGSGKGMWVKNEMTNILFQPFCKNDDIICIDASGEYIPLARAFNGKVIELEADGTTHLNPLHVTKEQRKEGKTGALGRISAFIALMSELKGESLTALEKSLIDEICIKVLLDKKPSLNAFFAELKNKAQAIPEAELMCAWLKRYTEGSVTLFSGEDTEQDVSARLTVYSIRKLPDELRGAVMLACLDRIERQIMSNHKTGKWTHLYIEEMHRYFNSQNPFSAERFAQFYAESRKFGAVITGITQLPRTVTANKHGEEMLSNSRFVVMGELDEMNISTLSELYSLNSEQMQILRSPQIGQYVLRTENAPIAVKLLYPGARAEDKNDMYDLFNTSFEGLADQQGTVSYVT